MEITDEIVDRIAKLAKLEFEKGAKEDIIKDLNRIIQFVEKLNELDTANVEPLVYMSDERNVLRKDTVKQEITQQQALKNAPQKDSDYFKAPKVIDNNS